MPIVLFSSQRVVRSIMPFSFGTAANATDPRSISLSTGCSIAVNSASYKPTMQPGRNHSDCN